MSEIYRWQQGIWSKLMRSRQFLGHALLLKGKQGIGKYDFARQLAKSLLCTAPTVDHEACGKCLSCGWFEHDSHPNFYSVMPEALDVMSGEDTEKKEGKEKSASATAKKSASQQIGVEQIRKLTDFVYLTGHQSGYYTLAALESLLKPLENELSREAKKSESLLGFNGY
jgi:DNA polymerase-3 subunit delta'